MKVTIFGKYEDGKFTENLQLVKSKECPNKIIIDIPDSFRLIGMKNSIWSKKEYITLEVPHSAFDYPFGGTCEAKIAPYVTGKRLACYYGLNNPNIIPIPYLLNVVSISSEE